MNTWFFKIEGRSKANSVIDHPFGFFVNCLISTEEGLEETKSYILSDLKEDGYEVKMFEHSGKYEEFHWDEKELQDELAELACQASNNPETIHYSTFHTWEEE